MYQYAQGEYEASFGRYDVDKGAHTFTYRVEGALVRSLVGKELPRAFELSRGRLVITSSNPDEHWRVTWAKWIAPTANWIAPIPSTTKLARLEENIGALRVQLTQTTFGRSTERPRSSPSTAPAIPKRWSGSVAGR